MAAITEVAGTYQAFTVEREELKLRGVKLLRLSVTEDEKVRFVGEVYQALGSFQTMIFVNTKHAAELLLQALSKMGISAQQLTGNAAQAERDKIIDDFRKLTTTSLICTNVLARGIDVPEVDLVINYHVPII